MKTGLVVEVPRIYLSAWDNISSLSSSTSRVLVSSSPGNTFLTFIFCPHNVS